MKPAEDIIGRRKVPEYLQRKGVSNKDVLDWARTELYGVEPDLRVEMIRKIKSGELAEVFLRPKKAGFFVSDGGSITFIEAYRYRPSFGQDLEEAERHWEQEEKQREWADEENLLFKRTTVNSHPRIGQALWEHGKRIVTYAEQDGLSVSSLLQLLDRRKGPDGYTRHTHQTSVDFYKWKPNVGAADPVLDWKWERIDAVLRFSSRNQVRDHLRAVLESTELGKMRDFQLTRLLGIKTRQPDLALRSDEIVVLKQLREAIRRLREPEPDLIRRSIRVVETAGKDNPADRSRGSD